MFIGGCFLKEASFFGLQEEEVSGMIALMIVGVAITKIIISMDIPFVLTLEIQHFYCYLKRKMVN